MYAAKTYLKAHPAPQSLDDVGEHTLIVYGETAGPEIRDINWLLEHYKKTAKPGGKGRIIRINNITGILQAVEAGLGIGVVPDYVAAQHPATAISGGSRARTCARSGWSGSTPSGWPGSARDSAERSRGNDAGRWPVEPFSRGCPYPYHG